MKNFTASPSSETFFATQAQEWEARYQSRTYRERRDLVLQTIAKELRRLGGQRKAIEVLDFGCGGGVLLNDLLKLGVGVTGVDTSRAMIEKARAQLGEDTGRVSLELLADGSGEGAYEARQYHIVVCTSVLEFVADMDGVLARLCSRVRDGGMLIVSVPNRRSWLRRLEKFIYQHPSTFRSLPRLNHLVQPDSYLHYQYRQLTLSELTEVVKPCGLRQEKYRFHVAPKLLRALEGSATIGMMLMAAYRK